ncbi:Zn-dependent protease [Kosmotoga arenicorallina S304]|uniref:Zn-dependent protease n=1 Tax=Kosmotoga arenicorallina S304 TaxID=1453497 RepID=A0A176K0U7_9BACT|nr:TldD/PmbA family protein [Kosmotoga arenicorallina]OAA30085.1 Zn-dependent protease [Kosmotoga arenicorallina S304]
MKIQDSTFLIEVRPLLKRLISELSKDYKYVSILGTDVSGKSYTVLTTGVSISDSNWTERGFVVRAFNDSIYSEYSFNELTEENFHRVLDNIRKETEKSLKNCKERGFRTGNYPCVVEERVEKHFNGNVAVPLESSSPSEIIEKLTSIKDRAYEYTDLLVNFMAAYEGVKVSKLFLSPNKDLMQSYMWSQGYVYGIVRKGNVTRYGYKSYSGLKGTELIDEMSKDVKEVVDKAVMLLDAVPIEPGLYDVICSPEVAGLIAHEAFGHGVEMDMFVKNRAKAVEYLNKPVASKLVEMHDGARAAEEVSSYLFDDEGTLGTDTTIIKDGVLLTGISDLLSALKLGTKPTGNGKRESFERKAYARMTNTFFSPGKDTLEEMIASIEHGYLLEDYYSGMEDPKNWGIQCMIAYGWEIKNGKFTGKIVSPVVMTGYVPDLLQSISMVSGELRLSGSGACGKGHKEWVKVSSGGPYIKAKARLG